MGTYKSVSDVIIKVSEVEAGNVALGLDFGLDLGFCYAIYSKTREEWHINTDTIGVLDLHGNRYESSSTCFLKLRDFLSKVNPSIIFYEHVRFTPPETKQVSAAIIAARIATAAELLTALRQTALLWAEDHNVPFTGIPTKTIKKLATGSGRANKQQMIAACNKLFGTDFDLNDNKAHNAADAAYVLLSGITDFPFAGENQ